MSSIERENESDLVNGLRCKEEQALEKIIMRYTGYVSVIVKGIIGTSMSQDDLEETVSDVFFTLWKNSERVQQGKGLPLWKPLGGNRNCLKPADFDMLRIRDERHGFQLLRSPLQRGSA